MSLNKCKECGNDVSSQAKTCPHCGARVKKSRWGIVVLLVLIVGACAIVLPIMRGRSIEQKRAEVEKDLKTAVEENVRESLNEEYGNQCASIKLLEGSDGTFSGTAKLGDGREIDIDNARIDGEMIRFKHIVKQGYEYKCKHHIDSIKLSVVHDPSEEVREGAWCLSGKVWNDGAEPIRGFVIVEIVDKNGRVCQRTKGIVPLRRNIILRGDGVKVFDWIPPGKSNEFMCISGEPITEEVSNMRAEFVNLGDEPLASVDYDSFENSMLDMINIKVTANIHPVQKEIVTGRELFEQFEIFRR